MAKRTTKSPRRRSGGTGSATQSRASSRAATRPPGKAEPRLRTSAKSAHEIGRSPSGASTAARPSADRRAKKPARPGTAASRPSPSPAAPTAAAPTSIRPAVLPGTTSSLDLDHRAARVPLGAIDEDLAPTDVLTAGDFDADVHNAHLAGDETPGGENPTPGQDVVDLIGRSLGVEYDDAEELRGADKIADRDRHRWELDPASSEDYRDRGRQ